jgi:hypothetical protein
MFLLKTKGQIGFVSFFCFGFVEELVRAQPDWGFEFQGTMEAGYSCLAGHLWQTCSERRATRCKRSTAVTGVELTDCLWAFVFSVERGLEARHCSPPIVLCSLIPAHTAGSLQSIVPKPASSQAHVSVSIGQ